MEELRGNKDSLLQVARFLHILDGSFGAQGHRAGLRVRMHGCELDLGAFGERKGVKSYLSRNSELRNKADVLQYNFHST